MARTYEEFVHLSKNRKGGRGPFTAQIETGPWTMKLVPKKLQKGLALRDPYRELFGANVIPIISQPEGIRSDAVLGMIADAFFECEAFATVRGEEIRLVLTAPENLRCIIRNFHPVTGKGKFHTNSYLVEYLPGFLEWLKATSQKLSGENSTSTWNNELAGQSRYLPSFCPLPSWVVAAVTKVAAERGKDLFPADFDPSQHGINDLGRTLLKTAHKLFNPALKSQLPIITNSIG